jgi:lysophospholipid acyltransferase (LPLAT)-like uncharacterized protein
MKLKDRLLLLIAPPIIALVIRLIHLSMRTEIVGVVNLSGCRAKKEGIIGICWHDQLVLMVFAFPETGGKLLVSASNDGELLARTMRYFKHGTIRGSSSRGGRAAFKQLLGVAKTDAYIFLTPDGPRGPRHELKNGVLQLAKLSGRPVLPVAFSCSGGYRLKSWDRCLIPYPFKRGVFSYGVPQYFETSDSIDTFGSRLYDEMAENQKRADEKLRVYGLSPV